MTLRGGQEGTVFRTLTVEGEDRVHFEFERPALDFDLDPEQAPGLDPASARAAIVRSAPDLTEPLLGLTARETYDVEGIAAGLAPGKRITVRAHGEDGTVKTFQVVARVDTPDDVEYYRHGGLLPYVLRGMLATA